jgi:hypothetical protein
LLSLRDSEIIVIKVKNTIHCNSPHLRNYQQEVHRLVDNFIAFNITTIPQSKNLLVDSLATTTSRLSPLEDYEASRFTINFYTNHQSLTTSPIGEYLREMSKIISFLTNEENFRDLAIDDEEFQEIIIEQEDKEFEAKKDNIVENPKLHTMPKGVVNLENLFDL